MQKNQQVVVVGAGIGGLTAALDLAAKGLSVTVLERAPAPGGKIREIVVDGRPIDSGPTVLTMRWVFEALFADAGETFADHVSLRPAEVLARHVWQDGEQLDLFADTARSAEAIGDFAGAGEASRFLDFCDHARATFSTLEGPFIQTSKATPLSLAKRAGLKGLVDLWRTSPYKTLWTVLGDYFHDPRLRQLFGRYATYCGSSPFDAPATLMLVSHVEQRGVWLVEGGIQQLPLAIERCAKAKGVAFHYGAEVARIEQAGQVRGVTLATGETIEADIVVVNADVAAVSAGQFGSDIAAATALAAPRARSLSAMALSMVGRTSGVPLVRHNVFFSDDYRKEFDEIFGAGQLPSEPTIYVCAQDRGADDRGADDRGAGDSPTGGPHKGPERLLVLINAPPIGDTRTFSNGEVKQCQDRVLDRLQQLGLTVEPETAVMTTPADFHGLYPATGGAIYGQATHGWATSFARPLARTRLPGLYLAGGSTHPGPGMPMAALSGRLAAASILADLTSAGRSRTVVTSGGTSTA